MADDLATVVKDKDFLAAQPNDQMAYLASVDPDFAKASPEERGAYLNSVLAPARKARAAQPTQFEKDRTPQGSGLWRGTKAFASDVAGAAKGVLENVPGMKTISDIGEGKVPDLLPGPSLDDSINRVKDMQAADVSRKKAGYSPLYRGAAALGQGTGIVDPTAMEQAAEHGDTAAIAGHTVLPMIGAAVGADEALGGKGRAALTKAKNTLPTIETPDLAGISKRNPALTRFILGDRLTALKDLLTRGKETTPAAKLPTLDPFAGATSSATPIGSAKLPPVGSVELPNIAKPAGAEPAPTRLPTLFEKGTRPEMLKMPNLVDQAAGVKPLKPDVPLIEQLTKKTAEEPAAIDPMKEKYPDPAVRQMVRANGERAYEAAKSDPGLMKDLHNLTRVDLRQALVNAGEDMGQTTVSNSKFAGEGSIPREEAFNRLLDKGLKPEQILKLAKPKPAETSQ